VKRQCNLTAFVLHICGRFFLFEKNSCVVDNHFRAYTTSEC